MTAIDSLVARVRETPEDDAPRFMLADALQERGDLWGEIARGFFDWIWANDAGVAQVRGPEQGLVRLLRVRKATDAGLDALASLPVLAHIDELPIKGAALELTTTAPALQAMYAAFEAPLERLQGAGPPRSMSSHAARATAISHTRIRLRLVIDQFLRRPAMRRPASSSDSVTSAPLLMPQLGIASDRRVTTLAARASRWAFSRLSPCATSAPR